MIDKPIDVNSFVKKNTWIVLAYNILILIFLVWAGFEPGNTGMSMLGVFMSIPFAILHIIILLFYYLNQSQKISLFKIILYIILPFAALIFWWIILPVIIIYIIHKEIKEKNIIKNFNLKTLLHIIFIILGLNFLLMIFNFVASLVLLSGISFIL